MTADLILNTHLMREKILSVLSKRYTCRTEEINWDNLVDTINNASINSRELWMGINRLLDYKKRSFIVKGLTDGEAILTHKKKVNN
jgi:hypothetical protein